MASPASDNDSFNKSSEFDLEFFPEQSFPNIMLFFLHGEATNNQKCEFTKLWEVLSRKYTFIFF